MTKDEKPAGSAKKPKKAKSTTAKPGGGKAPSRPSVPLWLAPPGGHASQVQGLFFQFDQFQWWTSGRLRALQLRQLQSLIDHAAKTVPYYRDSLRHLAGLSPGELTMEAVRALPILRRTDIQDAGDALVTKELPTGHDSMFDVSTSGSTGRPLVVKGSKVTGIFFQALGLRYHAWHRRDH